MGLKMRENFDSTMCVVVFLFLISISTCAATNLFSNHGGLSAERSNLDMMDDHHLDSGFLHGGTLLGHSDSEHHLLGQGLCEPIKIGLCMELGYNQTTMPNLVGHDVQGDADALLQTFTPLIQYGCSANLKLFLCSAHVPMCTDKVPQPIGPCRSLCESVRRKCEPVLNEFGFKWPPPLDCSKFHPANNHQHMCIPDPSAPDAYSPTTGGFGGFPSSDLPPRQGTPGNFKISNGAQVPGGVLPRRPIISAATITPPLEQPVPPGFQFPAGSVIPFTPKEPKPELKPTDVIEGGNSKECFGPRKIWSKGSCWIKCGSGSTDPSLDDLNGSLFRPSERSFARNYALLWAILSLSAAIIALTLSLCSPKLSTAERPIVYIALCQVLFSIGVILGSTGSVSCFKDKGTGMELLAVGGSVPSSCAVVFLLTYFFSMAATLWWVILCLSWLLALNRDLCVSLQQKEWSMFHLASWGLPSILTSAALIHKKVDVDELTGLCGVGFQNMDALTYYNMIPLNIALTLGLVFLIGGLLQRLFPGWKQLIFHIGAPKTKSSSCGHNCERQIRNGYTPVLMMPPSSGVTGAATAAPCGPHCHHPHRSNVINSGSSPLTFSTNGVQRLRALENSKAIWMRVGIFALVHSLPIACQVGTMAYELSSRERWENGEERPNLQIFLLRLNMNLIAGLTAGVWVLSTYSWKSVSSFLSRNFHCCCSLWSNRSKSAGASASSHTSHAHAQDKILHFRDGSLVTSAATATTDPLLPITTGTGSASASASANSPISNSRTNGILSSFQPGCHVNQNNFAGILPRHHNHPLPRIPVQAAAAAATALPPRTDAWRRGETIV